MNFKIQESKGDFSLYLYTGKNYGSGTAIEASLSADDPQSLNVEIKYIYNPDYPYFLAMSGPAGLTLELGRLDGEYELAFSYHGTFDRYRVVITHEKISVGSDTASFTSPMHIEWLRLGPDVIWFNTFSLEPGVIRAEDYVYLGKEDYQDYVNNFFAEIEASGARRFLPEEGYYPYSGFIPPWPERFIFKGDYTEVTNPDTPNVIWSEKWMDIRYYRFSGNIEEIIDLIDTNYELFSTQLYIALYDTEKQLYPYK